MLNNIKSKERGFTIVELLIVIVVIAILAAISIVAYNGIQNRGKASASQSTANSIVKKAEIWNSTQGSYPSYCQLRTNTTNPTGTTTCTAGSTAGPAEAKLDDVSAITTTALDATVANGGKVVRYNNLTNNASTVTVNWWKYDAASGSETQTMTLGS